MISVIFQTTITLPKLPFNVTAMFWSIVVSLAYGLYGYFTSKQDTKESFSSPMFVKTVLISIAVGAFMAYEGLDPLESWSSTFAFLTANSVFMLAVDKVVNRLLTLKGEIKIEVVTPTSGTAPAKT